MNKKVVILILLVLPILVSSKQVAGQYVVENAIPEQIEARKLDGQAKILADYLAKFDSPLRYHAQDFVDASREYGLDWKLVPAIAGVESTFGQFIPGGYNAWGWGVYGTQAIYFNSWREGIYAVSRGLRENYLNKGLIDPYSINRIYAASPYWGGKVAYFMRDLEIFAQKNGQVKDVAEIGVPFIKIAAISGQPVTR